MYAKQIVNRRAVNSLLAKSLQIIGPWYNKGRKSYNIKNPLHASNMERNVDRPRQEG